MHQLPYVHSWIEHQPGISKVMRFAAPFGKRSGGADQVQQYVHAGSEVLKQGKFFK
jgi:hypothetical protein